MPIFKVKGIKLRIKPLSNAIGLTSDGIIDKYIDRNNLRRERAEQKLEK